MDLTRYKGLLSGFNVGKMSIQVSARQHDPICCAVVVPRDAVPEYFITKTFRLWVSCGRNFSKTNCLSRIFLKLCRCSLSKSEDVHDVLLLSSD